MRLKNFLLGVLVCLLAAKAAFSTTETFTYSGPTIFIPQVVEADYIPASIYPATISVSGTTGIIIDVDVWLYDLAHSWPADMDILLASPTGQSVVLLSDAGSSPGMSNTDFFFDDEQTQFAPFDPFPLNSPQYYKPTNYEVPNDPDVFFAPAPPEPWGETLSVFDGYSANGDWSLYIMDDNNDYDGILYGWSLTITTALPEPACLGLVIASPFLIRRFRAF